jgi:CMP-N-acetylneuraminate monooxygenase
VQLTSTNSSIGLIYALKKIYIKILMIDIKPLGLIKYSKSKTLIKLKVSEIEQGLNTKDNFFVFNENGKFRIYDRVCDHRGGKLINKDNIIKCPIHNWIFDPVSGKYSNGIKKKQTPYKINGNYIEFYTYAFTPNISRKNTFSKEDKISVRFFNHAFLKFKTKNISFCTDPWAIGPAFYNGWWLKNKTHEDWIEELNSSDFIFISHNHPDHLHSQTLSKLDKDKNILVPSFLSNSTYLFLKDEGFKNIIKLEFEKEYHFDNSNLVLSIFKSGDFREDSGIYLSLNKFSALIDVDAGNINFNRFPKVDLYASSFAGGASGFPTMFENYSEIQKNKIIKLDRKFVIAKKTKNLLISSAKYFLPYAGFFQEKLKRDKYVKIKNKKNKIEDYHNFCEKHKIRLLNLNKSNFFEFYNENLIIEKKIVKKYYSEKNPNKYLKEFKKSNSKIDKKFLENYFKNSQYQDDLVLLVSLTDNTFKRSKLKFYVSFDKEIKFKIIKKIQNIKKNFPTKRILHLKIREEAFIDCIKNAKSWEDLLIGFQVKVHRVPNIFNSKFWNHFSNIYVSKKRVKVISSCNNCDVITQKLYTNIN